MNEEINEDEILTKDRELLNYLRQKRLEPNEAEILKLLKNIQKDQSMISENLKFIPKKKEEPE